MCGCKSAEWQSRSRRWMLYSAAALVNVRLRVYAPTLPVLGRSAVSEVVWVATVLGGSAYQPCGNELGMDVWRSIVRIYSRCAASQTTFRLDKDRGMDRFV
jgi:hypothetical protein